MMKGIEGFFVEKFKLNFKGDGLCVLKIFMVECLFIFLIYICICI